jgi:hypothetical protein
MVRMRATAREWLMASARVTTRELLLCWSIVIVSYTGWPSSGRLLWRRRSEKSVAQIATLVAIYLAIFAIWWVPGRSLFARPGRSA